MLVTAATLCRLPLLEAVRPVAADALRVAPLEQRARRDEGLVAAVTILAGRAGVQRRGVLVLVAGLANLRRRLAGRGVGRVHLRVAAFARRGLGLVVLVRPMAGRAGLRAVHHDGRHFPLRVLVAALAIFRGKWLQLRTERS